MIGVSIRVSGYENIVVDCPICDDEVKLNRASDLQTFKPISGLSVSCHECKAEFWINGDTVNERHEALIYDCYDHLAAKRYMNCILNVCQAYEMFFSLYLRVNLLYRPFAKDYRKGYASLDKLNTLVQELASETRDLSFVRMRDIYLRLMVGAEKPTSLEEAEVQIRCLQACRCPKDEELMVGRDTKLSKLLLQVKRTKINGVRNDVVHKNGYRPKRDEAEHALSEARSVLFPLTSLLDLHDDVNWYYERGR